MLLMILLAALASVFALPRKGLAEEVIPERGIVLSGGSVDEDVYKNRIITARGGSASVDFLMPLGFILIPVKEYASMIVRDVSVSSRGGEDYFEEEDFNVPDDDFFEETEFYDEEPSVHLHRKWNYAVKLPALTGSADISFATIGGEQQDVSDCPVTLNIANIDALVNGTYTYEQIKAFHALSPDANVAAHEHAFGTNEEPAEYTIRAFASLMITANLQSSFIGGAVGKINKLTIARDAESWTDYHSAVSVHWWAGSKEADG